MLVTGLGVSPALRFLASSAEALAFSRRRRDRKIGAERRWMMGAKEGAAAGAMGRREKAGIPAEAEIPMISLSQVPLEVLAKGRKEDAEMLWKAYKPPKEGNKKTIRLNAAGITALAMRLRAMEWARAYGRGIMRDSTHPKVAAGGKFVAAGGVRPQKWSPS
ncbi:MAG: hypothetical protein AMJ37_02575 [Dehalococcoidia bacterium DG_18]|nr:MAG: hypothetical protein AMJ37_02575 [Dehalococcoidia bacterium DG_18]